LKREKTKILGARVLPGPERVFVGGRLRMTTSRGARLRRDDDDRPAGEYRKSNENREDRARERRARDSDRDEESVGEAVRTSESKNRRRHRHEAVARALGDDATRTE